MNKLIVVLIVLVAVLVYAQTSPGIGLTSASTVAGCTTITGAAVTECAVTGSGLYIAVGTGAFAQVATGAVGSGGVASFNGRTGSVVPASADYSYSQLSSPPTTLNCPTAALSSGSTGTLTASSCTIR